VKRTNIKIALILSIFISELSAAGIDEAIMPYKGYIIMVSVFILLVLAFLLKRSQKALKENQILLNEKDEKIKWLRQISAENDYRQTSKIQDMEKKILELTYTIDKLEQKAKEGTKNQVVSKIEELQSKREKILQNTALKR